MHPTLAADTVPAATRVEVPGRGPVSVWDTGGPSSKPVLLLLHGWNIDAPTNFGTALAELRARYRTIMFDLQGHGSGLRHASAFRFDDCVTDALTIMDHLGVDRFTPVGYSMGGAIGQLLARRSPDRCEGLVLIASSRTFNTTSGERAQFAALQLAARSMRRIPANARRRIFKAIVTAACKPYPSWVNEVVLQGEPLALLEAGAELGRFDSTTWASDIDVPTAVVITERDSIVDPSRQQRLATAIPAAVMLHVDSDHDLPLLANSTFGATIAKAAGAVARGQRDVVPPASRAIVLH